MASFGSFCIPFTLLDLFEMSLVVFSEKSFTGGVVFSFTFILTFCVCTILVGLGCKFLVFCYTIGVLNEVDEEICSIDVIRFFNFVPCELLRLVPVLSLLVYFFGFTAFNLC